MVLRLLLALALTLAVVPARADVYKWIDAKGQVNYSNTPPPSAAGMVQPVEERISVSGADAATRDAELRMEARLAQRAYYEQLDWQQRQRAMVAQRGVPSYPTYPAYRTNYSPYSYGGRVFTAVVPRPVHVPHVRHRVH